MAKLNMSLGIRHLNNKCEDPFCLWCVVPIREGTLRFTGVSKTAEIHVKLPPVIICNSLLTCCISNQDVNRYSFVFV